MELFTTIIICTAAFGVAAALAAFIHQLLVSRDKDLNERAQLKAMKQKADELAALREQMQRRNKEDKDYQILKENVQEINKLDAQIEKVFERKEKLIQEYADRAVQPLLDSKGKNELINAGEAEELKYEIKNELMTRDIELLQLQQQRSILWERQGKIQTQVLGEEKTHNANLDDLYKQHTTMLEKIYMRQAETSERIAVQTFNSSAELFSSIIHYPLEIFRILLFQRSKISSFDANQNDLIRVKAAEEEINNEFALENNDSNAEKNKNANNLPQLTAP